MSSKVIGGEGVSVAESVAVPRRPAPEAIARLDQFAAVLCNEFPGSYYDLNYGGISYCLPYTHDLDRGHSTVLAGDIREVIGQRADLLKACQAARALLVKDLEEPGRTVFWQLVDAITKATGTPAPDGEGVLKRQSSGADPSDQADPEAQHDDGGR